MTHDNSILDPVDRLVHVNRDCTASFRAAAEHCRNSEMETMFSRYGGQHAGFASELELELERLGGRLSEEGGLGTTLHHGWEELKAALSGNSIFSMLKACHEQEEMAEVRYADAADAKPTGRTQALLAKQREQIREMRAHLHRLIDEMKDGTEFQTNEAE